MIEGIEPELTVHAADGFYGRARELGVLAAICGAEVSTPPLVVIHGEAGAGKTRLIARFTESLEAGASRAVLGTCSERGFSRQYEPWAQIVSQITEELGRDALVTELGSSARWLEPLLDPSGDAPAATTRAPSAIVRARLSEVLGRLLSSHRPAAVVLDDMQWASPESLSLLVDVALGDPELKILVAFRGQSLDLEHPLASTLEEIRRARGCEYLRLGGFDRSDAAALLQHVSGRALADAQVDALVHQTAGNAFYLTELGRYLRSAGALSTAPEAAHSLPETVRAAVGLRVARLSAESRRVLQIASVFSGDFSFSELGAMTELDEGTLLDCLDQALGEELISDSGPDRYAFPHMLVRRALYEQMSQSRRMRFHRRLAETIEALNAGHPERAAAELVHQFHASAALPGAERGAPYALIAADRARSLGAPLEAARILTLGLEIADGDARLRGRLLGRLAIAEAEAERFADALGHLSAAMDSLEGSGAPAEEIAELAIAVGQSGWVDPSSSRVVASLIHRAGLALGDRRDVLWARCRLAARPVSRLSFGSVTTLEWAPQDAEAVQVLRDRGSEADYAMTLNGWMPGFGADVEEAVTRLAHWTDPNARLSALIAVVGYLVLLDAEARLDEAQRLSDELILLAEEVGLTAHRSVAHALRAALSASRGRPEQAAGHFAVAHRYLESGPPARSSQALVDLLEVLTFGPPDGDWAALAERMWTLAQQPEQFSGWLSLGCAALAARAYAVAGDGDAARQIITDLLPAVIGVNPAESIAVNAFGLIVRAVWELRDPALAEQLQQAAPGADGRAFFTTCPELTRARLYALRGEMDAATVHFSAARELFTRADRQVLLAVCDHDEAIMHVEHGMPDGPALLRSVRMRAQAFPPLAWPVTMHDAIVPELPGGLTAREGEILGLLAARASNREIAAELVISVHTVERHVQNIYRKIGVANRAEAGLYARRYL